MHDGNELRLELGLHIMGDVFNCGGNGVMGCERGIHDYAKTFHLEIGLVQGFEGTAVVEIMIEWDGKMAVHDGGD